jgi:hypothetical protein
MLRRASSDAAALSPAGASPRRQLSLLRQPVRTVRLAAQALPLRACARWLHAHRVAVVLPLLSLLSAAACAHRVHGPHSALVAEAEDSLSCLAWWLGLGVLSSVGFGAGMHSGLLFLLPHVALIVRSAEACCSVAFDSRRNKWFAMGAADLFTCPPGACDAGAGSVSYLQLLGKALPPCLVWGCGTALGEVPPYFLGRAAFRAAAQSTESHASAAHAWMERVLQRRGWLGVVALSAWPNSLFGTRGGGRACGSARSESARVVRQFTL